MNFREAAADLDSVSKTVGKREEICRQAIDVGKQKCEAWGLEIERIIRPRKRKFLTQLNK